MDKLSTLPVYKIRIGESEELGIEAIALVDDPAIERTWKTFSKVKPAYFSNEERQIVSGPIMVANLPIYRRDEKGEYFVVFDKETIFSIVERFLRKGFSGNVNIMHDPSQKLEGISLFNLFIIDKTMGIHTPDGYPDLMDGSAFASYKINDPEVWKKVKDGTFTGFSVEGFFDEEFFEEKETGRIMDIIDKVQNISV